MFRSIKKFVGKFKRDDRGNFALLTAGAALPLLMMIAGSIELAEHSKLKRAMQSSSDSAVMAAFQDPKARWNKRREHAQRFFDANFRHTNRVQKMKTHMTRDKLGKREILTFTAETQADSLFGELNPLADTKIEVEARAEYVRGSGQPPRLISGAGEASVGN